MKEIKNYEGLYAITSCGKVWSYRGLKFLKPKVRKDGYLDITLSRNGEKKTYSIHRLVAEAYVPNPEGLPQVGHKDETKDNNSVPNLYWTTAKDNCNMPKRLQRKSKSLLNNATSKKALCIEINTAYASMSEAARSFGCTPLNIYLACRHPEKTACGFHWRYIYE